MRGDFYHRDSDFLASYYDLKPSLCEPFKRISLEIVCLPFKYIGIFIEKQWEKEKVREVGNDNGRRGFGFVVIMSIPFILLALLIGLPFLVLHKLFDRYKRIVNVDIILIEKLVNRVCGFK